MAIYDVYSDEDETFIRTNAQSLSQQEIADALGKTTTGVRCWMSRHKVPGRKRGLDSFTKEQREYTIQRVKETNPVTYRSDLYTENDKQYIRDSASTLSYQEIADALGKKKSAIAAWCADNKIKGIKTGENHPRWTGGRVVYSKEWKETVREVVLERDGFTCQECNFVDFSGFKLRAHHIVPWKLTGDNRLCNHVTLCVSCHTKQKAHRWKEYTDSLLETLPEYQQKILGVL